MTTLIEAIEAVNDWIRPARDEFRAGRAVQVVFSPGEGTRYVMIFTPPEVFTITTDREYPELGGSTGALTVLYGLGKPAIINAHGAPVDCYVEEKLGVESRHTVAAVGICWALMVGETPEYVSKGFRSCETAVGEWRLDMFTPQVLA